MSTNIKKRRTVYKRSKTRKELCKLNRKLSLLKEPSVIEKRMLKGDHGLVRGQLKGAEIRNKRFARIMKIQAQKRLVEQELIKLEEKGEKIRISLTRRGRIEVLKQSIVETKKQLPEGKYCLISFDIPEHTRNIRWMIRHLLKEADFEIVHLSLWKSKKDVVGDLVMLINEIGASEWVKIYLAEEY